jgi:hypothetical protein
MPRDQVRAPASPLSLWVIYESPRDFPGRFVVRCHHVNRGGVVPCDGCFVCGSLAEARDYLPDGSYYLGRHPQDEPQIVEVWI